ncbi:MAG: hypothetical protein AAF242_20790 [Bacteroidota bacterium]
MQLKITCLLAIGLFNVQLLIGQTETQTIQLKKGEVFDILLLNQNPETSDDLKDYFKTVFPVAHEASYQSIPGFRVAKHSQGNLRPDLLTFGKWSSLSQRENFLRDIDKEIPDFHERRRKIWSYFGIQYFEIQEDLSLEIDRDRYLVATAYWLESTDASTTALADWKNKVAIANGQVLLELSDGKSPFAYRYNPDIFMITSWESEAAFKAFQSKVQDLGVDHLQHLNEFILE